MKYLTIYSHAIPNKQPRAKIIVNIGKKCEKSRFGGKKNLETHRKVGFYNFIHVTYVLSDSVQIKGGSERAKRTDSEPKQS